MRVLVTDGDDGRGRDVIAAVRGLSDAGYHPSVTVVSQSWRAAPSRYCEQRVRLPPVTDDAYPDAVRAAVQSGSYLAVIPASEASLAALGVSVPHLLDKIRMSEAAEAAGLLVPPSRAFGGRDELLAHAGDLAFPVVVKPVFRRYWAFRADTRAQLAAGVSADGPLLVQPYLNLPMSAVAGVVWDGSLPAAVHERWLRIWPGECGLASAAETVAPDERLEARLVELLGNHRGLFCAQFIGPYLIDLNLRIHSSHPLAVAAGANLVAVYCRLVAGANPGLVRARPGVFYRWLEGDVRHVLAAVRRRRLGPGAAVAALRPRRATAHGTESLRDPLPMLERAASALERRLRRWSSSAAGVVA